MQILRNVNILLEIFNMKVYNMRHHKSFSIIDREARISKFFPIDGDRSFEANEWTVQIGINRFYNNYTQCIGPFTLTDLKRLRRVIKRAIKIVENPKKHNPNSHW